MLRATNVDGTNDATVDVRVVDSSSSDSYIARLCLFLLIHH